MTPSPAVFTFTAQSVRVVVIDEAPWFVAADVCEALAIQNVTQAVARLDDDERAMFNIGRQGKASIINESGLYSLIILGSSKPEAKKFKKWVTSEVLPAIRKTGRYIAPAAPVVVHETLSNADILNLTRMVWLICGQPAHRQSWVQAVWYRLRQVCQCPSPQRFQVRHRPLLAAEVKRLAEVSMAFTDAVSDAEKTVLSRIIRQGEDEAPILADITRAVRARPPRIASNCTSACYAGWKWNSRP